MLDTQCENSFLLLLNFFLRAALSYVVSLHCMILSHNSVVLRSSYQILFKWDFPNSGPDPQALGTKKPQKTCKRQ